MLIKTGGTLCRVEPFWMKCVFTEYTAFLLPRRRTATSEPRTREHAAPRRRAVWQATGQLWVWWLPETQCLFSGCASMLGVCVYVCVASFCPAAYQFQFRQFHSPVGELSDGPFLDWAAHRGAQIFSHRMPHCHDIFTSSTDV